MINHTKLIVSSIVMLILDFINLHLRKIIIQNSFIIFKNQI